LADHPNLVYSDGNEWALYRRGTLVGRVVRAAGDVREDGASTFDADDALAIEALLRDFFSWEPIVPANPRSLAEALAPLTRLLREHVRLALATPDSALTRLAEDWRDFFFPEADDAQFADAYAQTVTYALLLARVEGESDLHGRAAERLDRRQELLAQVLRVLAEPAARQEVDVPMDLLERAIAAVDPEMLMQQARGRDVCCTSTRTSWPRTTTGFAGSAASTTRPHRSSGRRRRSCPSSSATDSRGSSASRTTTSSSSIPPSGPGRTSWRPWTPG
jgi:hypothetical protein